MSDSHYIFDLENEIREMAVDSYDEVHKQITIDTERVYPIITDWLDIPQNMVSQLTECFYPNYEEAYERSIPNRRFQINLRGQIYGDFDYVEFIRALIKFTDKWDYAKW